jgi:hypothetical protein
MSAKNSNASSTKASTFKTGYFYAVEYVKEGEPGYLLVYDYYNEYGGKYVQEAFIPVERWKKDCKMFRINFVKNAMRRRTKSETKRPFFFDMEVMINGRNKQTTRNVKD